MTVSPSDGSMVESSSGRCETTTRLPRKSVPAVLTLSSNVTM